MVEDSVKNESNTGNGRGLTFCGLALGRLWLDLAGSVGLNVNRVFSNLPVIQGWKTVL